MLLVGSFMWPMYTPAFLSGFKELGCEVSCLNTDEFCYKDNILSKVANNFLNRFHIGSPIHKLNNELIDRLSVLSPDFIFLYRTYSIYPKTCREIKKRGIPLFTYNNDDPFCGVPSTSFFRYFLKSTLYADYNFVYRKKNVADYMKIGVKNAGILLPYFIKKNNFYIQKERDISIAFLGHFESDGRDIVIKKMVDAGIPVMVFGGDEWKAAPLYDEIKDVIQPKQGGKAYNDTLNRLQIAIVFLSKINHDTYTRRCFELPITKTLMLCEYTNDMDYMFPDNECAVYFRNPDEAVAKSKSLLENPSEICRIAENGYNRVLQLGCTETDRCKEIILKYNELTSK